MKHKRITEKILAYIDKILAYCAGCAYEDFRANSQLIEACVFNLSQIGELANKIEPDFADGHAGIPWKKLYGLRNKIVHDYEGINFTLIWEIIQDDLPKLKTQLEAIEK
jgi:uncharacterized protein with HEPN domain